MRFAAIIMCRDILLARVSVDPREGETVQATAERAAATLDRDANRHRSDLLPDEALSRFKDLFRDTVAEDLPLDARRTRTCLVDGDRSLVADGMIATLTTSKNPLTCIVESLDSKWLRETERFLETL